MQDKVNFSLRFSLCCDKIQEIMERGEDNGRKYAAEKKNVIRYKALR